MRMITLAFLAVGLFGCSGAKLLGTEQAKALEENLPYEKNPLLGHFMDVCSVALRNKAEGIALAQQSGWKPVRPGDTSLFERGGDVENGGLRLIVIAGENSSRASSCEITGSYVPPAYGAYFDQLEVPSYQAETVSSAANVVRRLKGTSSFGDPITIEATASVAQGAAVVLLEMKNLSLAPDRSR